MNYNKYSDYLKKKYGEKVYKLPVNIECGCPNKDKATGMGGCIFCGEEAAGFECLPANMTVCEQLKSNSFKIGRKYGASKFIVYFQNYSNTYLPQKVFENMIIEACSAFGDNNNNSNNNNNSSNNNSYNSKNALAAIYLSTRPDCISENQMEFLKNVSESKKLDIVVELGLQTINHKTLRLLERGHSLAEFINAVLLLRKYHIDVCAHYIVDLPMDTLEDVVEGAKILSALKVSQVKCHSLYIIKNTRLAEMYLDGSIKPVGFEEYLERLVTFLDYLDPNIVIQRITGRAPAERTLFCNFGMSWWKIAEIAEKKMEEEGRYQGRLFDYLECKYPKE